MSKAHGLSAAESGLPSHTHNVRSNISGPAVYNSSPVSPNFYDGEGRVISAFWSLQQAQALYPVGYAGGQGASQAVSLMQPYSALPLAIKI